MGGCTSKSDTKTGETEELTRLKQNDTTCEPINMSRPASSTAGESTTVNNRGSFSFRGKPHGLNVGDCSSHNPNALNITPHANGTPGFAGNDEKDRHEEDLNRLAMFIPWEKPILGGANGKKPKKKKARAVPGGVKTAGKQDTMFIPGSGNEKILLSSKPNSISELPPLNFKKVKASSEVKSQIQKDREKIQKRKAQTKAILGAVKQVFTERDETSNEYTQMRGQDASRAIVAIIDGYAQFGAKLQTEFTVVSKEHIESINKASRVTYSCPVRAS